jgi:putative membrane protein
MKKVMFGFSIFLILVSVFTSSISAQGMMNWSNTPTVTSSIVSSTAQEEAEGKDIWDKLQSKQFTCRSLTDDNFDVLGEYFMGQSVGNTERHAAMNQMMKNMMGEQAETQMHISLGKRSSECDTNAPFPSGYGLPMMGWMMGGGGNPMMGYGGWNNWNNMMSWGGFGFGWIFMIVFWMLIVLGVVALVRYLGGAKQSSAGKTPLDILKERYAKGEINKKEFEEMKKDIR